MPHNQIKKYPELLEIMHLNEWDRRKSLRAIFDRDITDNPSLKFNNKVIRPTKIDGELDLGSVFRHLITEDYYEVNENGKKVKNGREFEKDRAQRLHWLKPHIDCKIKDEVHTYSVEKRNMRKRKNVIRTYILNVTQRYVVVLEPQKSNTDYYLLSAYHLNKKYGLKQMKKKMNDRLDILH